MAYGGNQKNIKDDEVIPELLLNGSDKNAGDYSESNMLMPNKNLDVRYRGDLYEKMIAEKDSYKETYRALNALQTISPIVCALAKESGTDLNADEQMAKDFLAIIDKISAESEKLCEILNVNTKSPSNKWVKNQLEQALAKIIKGRWEETNNLDIEFMQNIAKAIVSNIDKFDDDQMEISPTSEKESIALAGVSAMLDITAEIVDSKLIKDVDIKIEEIYLRLFTAAENGLSKIAPEFARSDNRARIFSSLLMEAGKLYADMWRVTVKNFNAEMSVLKGDDRKRRLDEKRASGWSPIVATDQLFDLFYLRIIVITEKILKVKIPRSA